MKRDFGRKSVQLWVLSCMSVELAVKQSFFLLSGPWTHFHLRAHPSEFFPAWKFPHLNLEPKYIFRAGLTGGGRCAAAAIFSNVSMWGWGLGGSEGSNIVH